MSTGLSNSEDDSRSKLRIIVIGSVTLLLLVLSYTALQSSLEERLTAGTERDFQVTIPEHADGSALPTFKARQGDHVTIRIRSEVMGEANLHGYEKKITLRPGQEVTLSFNAQNAGMYPLHLHQEVELRSGGVEVMHRHLAALEIQPH